MSGRKLVSLGSLLVLCIALSCLGQGTGTIRYEVWEGIGGTRVEDLTDNANFPDNPSFDDELTLFEAPIDIGDNFGGRIYGWLHPDTSGDYTFWISADDFAKLYLSTTDSVDDAMLIANVDGWTSSRQWDKYDSQTSAPVTLTAGQAYYIEALYKEGGGGDNLAVAWALSPDMNDLVVIDGAFLSPAPRQASLLKARNVGPADGAVDVMPDITLEWTPGPTAITNNVYLSMDATIDAADLIAETADASVAVALDLDTTYYWRVDAVDADAVHEGPVWTFTVIAIEAHFPVPADGATLQAINAQLIWVAGLDALVHDVFFSTDMALVEARDPSVQIGRFLSEPTVDPGLLENDTTYYWVVDEKDPTFSTNPGHLWSFSTIGNIPITDESLLAWYTFDGTESGVVLDQSGHGNSGIIMGENIVVVDDSLMGQVLSLPGGDNQFVDCGAVGLSGNDPTTSACFAKADNTSIPDWTLIFGFTGTVDGGGGSGSHFNIGSLGGPGGVGAHVWGWEETIFSDEEALEWHHYAMTYDGTTIAYYGDGVLTDTEPEDVKSNVRDLSTRGDRVHIGSRVTQSSSFPGDVADCRVYNRVLTEVEITQLALRIADVTGPNDVVVGVPDEAREGSVAGWPGGEHPALAIDDDVLTKYLHFKGEVEPTGFRVAPDMGATVVMGLTFTTANDATERDPVTYELSGSNGSIDGPYELIASGEILDFAQDAAWPRRTMNATPISFENTAEYTYYQLMFPTVRDAGGANSMQIAEVELLGRPIDPVLLYEDFEGLALGPNVDEALAGDQVWTDTPPEGWAVDESGVPGIGDPATDGVTEWAGWAFADKAWWSETAGDQRRSEFELASGTVAVADPDEWDDAPHDDSAAGGWYKTFLRTPEINIAARAPGSLWLIFDSSWRPEFDSNYHQTANVTVSYDGGTPIEVLLWESDEASASYKPPATNETVVVDLQNPAGAQSLVLTFGLFDAGNDWWWAIDNVEVTE